MTPPRLLFLSTDSGRGRFHYHLNTNGKVCINTLNAAGIGLAEWSSDLSITSVLVSLQSCLNQQYTSTHTGRKLNSDGECERYNQFLRHETARVAVCDPAG
ncbi:hypothetical protein MRX96_046394 [Rhipicephalus microplus]